MKSIYSTCQRLAKQLATTVGNQGLNLLKSLGYVEATKSGDGTNPEYSWGSRSTSPSAGDSIINTISNFGSSVYNTLNNTVPPGLGALNNLAKSTITTITKPLRFIATANKALAQTVASAVGTQGLNLLKQLGYVAPPKPTNIPISTFFSRLLDTIFIDPLKAKVNQITKSK